MIKKIMALIATVTNFKSENFNEMKLVDHLVSIFHYDIAIGTSKYSGMPSTDHILNFARPVLLFIVV